MSMDIIQSDRGNCNRVWMMMAKWYGKVRVSQGFEIRIWPDNYNYRIVNLIEMNFKFRLIA